MLCQRAEIKYSIRGAIKTPEYIEINREIIRKKQRLRYILQERILRDFKHRQAVQDIERQLAGLPVEEAPEVAHTPITPAQKELSDSIFSTPGTNENKEKARRDRAIRAVTAYCGLEEGGTSTARRKQRQKKTVLPTKT